MTTPWSFNQPVLLKKTRRNSSVLVWTLVGATSFAGLWAFLAPLPETVAVQGKLQPSSAVQDIEAPLGGVVKEVLVQEGQAVAEGDLLIRFDARKAQARLDSALSKRDGLNNQLVINRALVGDVPPTDLTLNQAELLDKRRVEFKQSNTANDEALARSRATLVGLRQSLEAAKTIADRYESLMQLGAASELRVLEERTKAEGLQSNVQAEEREYKRLSSIRTAEASRREAQRRREIEDSLRLISDLDREIRQAEVVLSDIDITAPIEGLVFDLSVQRGSVIQPSTEVKPLLKLIPQDDLLAKVYIPNNAIGFIKPGQRADISLNSFNAGDYGFFPATVKRVGSDALTPDEQREVLGTDVQGLYFPATLQLSSQTLAIGTRAIKLQPGMSLTADLHLRTRRFISAITDLMEDKRRSLERMR
tara:strand:- start:1632 stop:2891 length:1260 start_codon:yes stop_codon:yes gene_type:complete